MPFSNIEVALQRRFLIFLVNFALLAIFAFPIPQAFAQSRLDDVHIASRKVNSALPLGSAALNAGLHVIRKDVNLVLVPVSVIDPLQRLVVGLHLENFQVFEGKKPQEIKHFSSEDAPVSVGIIVDSSGSMKDKIDRVREAVRVFCESANPQDEFFIITFADEPRLAMDFTNSPSEIEKEMLFTVPKGRTSLLDAIYMGLGKMKEARYGKKALLIISDGGDNHSRYSEKDVKAAARESDVTIYAIGTFDRYVPTEEEALGPELLSDIAEPTGGRAFTLTNANDMPDVAHLIGTELRTQYVLGYRPSDVANDGKWHKISVKLRLPDKWSFLRVHAKSGYYAQTQ